MVGAVGAGRVKLIKMSATMVKIQKMGGTLRSKCVLQHGYDGRVLPIHLRF